MFNQICTKEKAMNKKEPVKSLRTMKVDGQSKTWGKHPSSLANLRKWKKGQSGNPGGRPKKYGKLAKSLNDYGEKKAIKYVWNDELSEYTETKNDMSYKEEVLEVIWQQARKGHLKHIELLANLGCLDKK